MGSASKPTKGLPKRSKPHKKIRQDGRPNGKRWKRGLAPDKRN